MLKAEFERIGNMDESSDYDRNFKQQMDMRVKQLEEAERVVEQEDAISAEEVKEAIKTAKMNKAMDLYRVSNELIVHGGDELANTLLLLFNVIYKYAVWPVSLELGKIVPLHKDGPKDKVDNYRGITILPNISKIFERIIYNRLVSMAEEHRLISDEQGGFRAHRSATDQIVILHEIAAMRRARSKQEEKIMYTAFLDVKKAYDTTYKNAIYSIMLEKKVDPNMAQTVRC